MVNLDFARIHMKLSIYEQAVLEGVATSFPQTEDIIENGKVNGVTASDVQKILNLKHAWEFILDKDVLQVKSDYSILCHIAKLVNEGFFESGGRIRRVLFDTGPHAGKRRNRCESDKSSGRKFGVLYRKSWQNLEG
jgi:hypothetical protein